MYLLDTCVLVSALTRDQFTGPVVSWLADHADQPLAVSDWTAVEFMSVIAAKRRADILSEGAYRDVLAAYRRQSQLLQRLMVGRGQFQLAEQLCRIQKLCLRSGDALHFAVALEQEAVLVTTDKALLAANGAFGLRCQRP